MPDLVATNAAVVEGFRFQRPAPTPIEAARQAQYYEMQREAAEKGWPAASIVNINPYSIHSPSVLLNGLRISGVPHTEEMWAASLKLKLKGGLQIPFVHHVITNPSFTVLEQVAGTDTQSFMGSIKNKTWWPMDLAKDIVTCNNNNENRGGVFIYKGEHSPLSNPETRTAEQELLEKAYQETVAYCTMYFQRASDAHASRNVKEISQVGPYHRWCTKYLRLVGVLERDPDWLVKTVSVQDRAPVYCQRCGTETNRKAAACSAPGCGYILDPFRAFKEGIFDLETPGAVTTLRRLSKHQLKELKLYPRIKPLEEYLANIDKDEEPKEAKSKAKD